MPTVPVAVRLPLELADRLDQFVESQNDRLTVGSISRAHVIIEALKRGLDSLEDEAETKAEPAEGE